MRSLVAGNWKMNGLDAALAEIERVAEAVAGDPPAAEVLICPPATLVARAVSHAAGRIAIGGQDCHAAASGAFTGDVSAEMLKDAGARFVIVGHSERRRYHCETDADVAAKAQAAWRAGLTAIICVGETQAQRDAGRAHDGSRRRLPPACRRVPTLPVPQLPMSRYGRSAPGARRQSRTSCICTRMFAPNFCGFWEERGRTSVFFTAAPSRRPMPVKSWRCRRSEGHWLEGRA